MAEYTSIPCKLNGTPIPDLSDVSVQMARTVNQNATTNGVKQTHGQPKWQAQLTFKSLYDRAAFVAATGAYQLVPMSFNLQYQLGVDGFTLERGIVSGLTAQTDQDGSASLQLTVMAEDHVYEGPVI